MSTDEPTGKLTLRVGPDDHRLDVATWGNGPVRVIFAHDGLGSIAQWRDVPARTARASGSRTLAYNRAGHGASFPCPTGPWPPDWMHREAAVLTCLIEAVADGPVRLVGHSDGATIALLCAAGRPDLVSDIVSLAAHSWVEAKCVAAIRSLRADPTGLVRALGRYHRRPAELFEAWSGGWTRSEFADWDIRARLGAVDAPTVVVQGDTDEYATAEMATQTAAAIGSQASVRVVPDCSHMIHRDAQAVVVELSSGAATRVRPR